MSNRKTKKFIDKKNSVTFHLVHRSQRDPLIADETAPQRVLVPVDETQAAKHEKKTSDNKPKLDNKRKEEQQKYGIYFDDDYDYLQHLKDVNSLPVEWQRIESTTASKNEKKDTPKLNLPSSVFASNVEEKIGLLNKAAPVSGLQLDLDPDIVAGLDDDFDYDDPDNQLEDNFMELANAESGGNEFPEDEGSAYETDESNDQASHASFNDYMKTSDEEEDDVCSLNGPQYTFREEETKSRFTEYSISSSVIRRNKQLTLVDDKFEKMYAAYDEVEIGALDCDEIEGYIAPDSDIVLQYAKEFERTNNEDKENLAQLMKDKLKVIEKEYSSSDENDNLEELITAPREKDKWDCESILSTYSNIYNHPKLIVESKGLGRVKVNPRTGIPKDESTGKLTSKALAQFDSLNDDSKSQSCRSIREHIKSQFSIMNTRNKGESSEERRERKKALKYCKRERRKERKFNTEAFKEEKKRQEKILINCKRNIQGNTIL